MLQKFIKYLLKHHVIFALFIIGFGWFLFQIRDIIVSIFLSYIIMAALLPYVEFLRKKKVPKVLAVLIPYVGVLLALLLLIFPLVPFVIGQIQSLAAGFPKYVNKASEIIGFSDPVVTQQYIKTEASNLSGNAFSFTTHVFGGLFSILTTFIISFYMLMYNDSFKKFISRMFDTQLRPRIMTTLERANDKLGSWLRGQVLLCFSIGVMSWVALTLIGLPYALPLALLAGLLEVIPTLGPILAAVPAVIVALSISPTMAVGVAIIYILIQALENNLLVPNIMQKAVGLNPVVVILAILIGSKLMGVAGALLAIPFVSFVIVLYSSFE